jgi:lipid-A-disaccharide synthase
VAEQPVRIFISAGEASGDLYGARIIEAVRSRLSAAEFFGCGGDHMRAAGCNTLVDAHAIAMVGLVEVVPGLARAWKALRNLKAAITRERPALAILIDFPDFNLRLAKHLKQAGVPVIYFVAPQVWAWRPWRLKAIRESVDRLLCIFPFEEPFFRNAGVTAEFAGHPLAGRVAPTMTGEEFRKKVSLPLEGTLIALLPGSREKEILLNLPPMLAAARLLAAARRCFFVLPAASTVSAAWVREQVASAGLPLTVVENLTYDAIAHADAAIVASGTAATETALLGTPMVIVYRVSGTSWFLGKWLVHTRFYSMVNLVAGREIVPEYIQDRFQPAAVAQEVSQILDLPAVRDRIREDLQTVANSLHRRRKDNEPAGSFECLPGTHFVDPIQRAAALAESILKEGK